MSRAEQDQARSELRREIGRQWDAYFIGLRHQGSPSRLASRAADRLLFEGNPKLPHFIRRRVQGEFPESPEKFKLVKVTQPGNWPDDYELLREVKMPLVASIN